MHGHVGLPKQHLAAPHVFKLARREDCFLGAPDGIKETASLPDDRSSIVMLVKSRMHSQQLSQPPFLFVEGRFEAIVRRWLDSGSRPLLAPRKRLTDALAKNSSTQQQWCRKALGT